MGEKHQFHVFQVPKGLDRQQRLDIADLVIEHIVERTGKGKDKWGDPFPKYSKSYIKSLDFINAGKSKGKVNLQLSGDMLAALTLLDEFDGKIKIGFQEGSEENARADGNIRGTYGTDTPDTKLARDFLGLDPKKLKTIIDFVVAEGDADG